MITGQTPHPTSILDEDGYGGAMTEAKRTQIRIARRHGHGGAGMDLHPAALSDALIPWPSRLHRIHEFRTRAMERHLRRTTAMTKQRRTR